MANRSYLYSLSNRPPPTPTAPRRSSVCPNGLDVPFIYRLLMSGDPQPCASLVSDGMEDEEPGSKTRLYAISSVFEPGYARMRRFADIVRAAVAQAPAPRRHPPQRSAPPRAPQPASFMDRVKQMFSPQANAAPAPVPAPPAAPASDQLLAALDETLAFLDAHRDSHLLLETIELDIMSHAGEAELKACVDAEIVRCRHAGAALTRCRPSWTKPPARFGRPLPGRPRNRWTPSTDCAWTRFRQHAHGRHGTSDGPVLERRAVFRIVQPQPVRSASAAGLSLRDRAGPPAPDGLSFSRAPCPAPVPANPARVNRAGFVTHLQSVTMPAACSGRHVAHR